MKFGDDVAVEQNCSQVHPDIAEWMVWDKKVGCIECDNEFRIILKDRETTVSLTLEYA
jgi:hypothetical protein